MSVVRYHTGISTIVNCCPVYGFLPYGGCGKSNRDNIGMLQLSNWKKIIFIARDNRFLFASKVFCIPTSLWDLHNPLKAGQMKLRRRSSDCQMHVKAVVYPEEKKQKQPIRQRHNDA